MSHHPIEKPKLIVTGASGLLGHALCARAVGQWSVLALYRRNKPKLAAVTPIQVDLRDPAAVHRLIKSSTAHAIIHTAAAAQVEQCESRPRHTTSINVAVPGLLAEYCAEKNIAYVFTSTDLVFNGRQAPYQEKDPVNPVCAYGEQKAQAEAAVLQRYPQALVCRLPLLFGMAPFSGHHFSVQGLQAIRQGQSLQLLTDEYRTPVDSHSAAQGILHLLGRANGLMHLGGRTRISRYDLGCMMAAHMQVKPDMIRPVTIDTLDLKVARSPDCSLDSRKAYGLGYAPTHLAAAVKDLVSRFDVISNR